MVRFLPHPCATISSWFNPTKPVNKETNKKPTITLNHHILNNFLPISVVAVIIYVRSHVNVPFHLIQLKIVALHQYLLDKIVRVPHRSTPRIIVVRKFEYFIEFLLATDHFRRYISERHLIEIKSKQIFLPRLSLSLFLFSSSLLLPSTFASKLPSTSNLDLFLFNDYALTISFNSSSLAPHWNAGCCIQSNQTMCDTKRLSTNFTHSIYLSNETEAGTFLFDGVSDLIGYRRLPSSTSRTHTQDFLNNQTLFCQRYDDFRRLSGNHLAIFTYGIVIIGIIFNSFVFVVLLRGSMRRSTSFTLFLALTIFDLLSLASILFALLFRTVITYLKTFALFCKMFGIFFLYFRQCSSTTLLLIAIERCTVIKYPFCRYLFEKFRLPLLAFIMLIYAIPIPFDFIFYTTGSLHCEAFNTSHARRYQIFRGFFTVFSYAMIPFAGISISNLLIINEVKNSRKRLKTKDDSGTKRHLSTNTIDQRGTTVMLFVASFAFLLLLGPFYLHWCITYLFHNYPQCHFTRNLYENIQVCMGVFNPYLTIIEKGMREMNHAVNFLLYMATSKRFRSDFKHIFSGLFYNVFASGILYVYKRLCSCCPEPSCLVTLEQHMLDATEQSSNVDGSRKNQAAYKTSHYYSNVERRRQTQLLQSNLLNNNTPHTTVENSTPVTASRSTPVNVGKTARTLTYNQYDPLVREHENKRQAARLSRHYLEAGGV